MKHIPLFFPLLPALIILSTFFAGAYAVARATDRILNLVAVQQHFDPPPRDRR